MAKPRTKLEHKIFNLSKTLPALTEKHELYGNDMVFWPNFTVSRKTICCLECGHKWKAENIKAKRHTCPSCNKHLHPRYNESWMRTTGYMVVIDKCQGYQVLRFMFISKIMRKGQKPSFNHLESSQVWIAPDGTYSLLGAMRNSFGNNSGGGWKYDQSEGLSCKQKSYYLNQCPYTPYVSTIYPKQKVIKKLRRNGFKTTFHNLNPTEAVIQLLTDNRAETLLKLGYIKAFKKAVMYPKGVEKRWNQLRIAIRHGYKISDYAMWDDYLDLLEYFKKDLHNPKFLCPDNLKEVHNKLMVKKKRITNELARRNREEQAEKRRQELEMWRVKYPEIRKTFLDFSIKHKNIEITVIKSVEQLKEESELLEHCAYINGYYGKEESLLLSAKVNGKIVETIEINTNRMEVVQNRGFDNKVTEYGDRILKLIQGKLPELQKRKKKQSKMAA